jgi:hypothetical protein
MVFVEETNRDKLGNAERSASGEGTCKLPSNKVIDFESGRKALEKSLLEEEQSRSRLMEHIRLPGGYPTLGFELLITMAMIFALLLGLYVGLIGS